MKNYLIATSVILALTVMPTDAFGVLLTWSLEANPAASTPGILISSDGKAATLPPGITSGSVTIDVYALQGTVPATSGFNQALGNFISAYAPATGYTAKLRGNLAATVDSAFQSVPFSAGGSWTQADSDTAVGAFFDKSSEDYPYDIDAGADYWFPNHGTSYSIGTKVHVGSVTYTVSAGSAGQRTAVNIDPVPVPGSVFVKIDGTPYEGNFLPYDPGPPAVWQISAGSPIIVQKSTEIPWTGSAGTAWSNASNWNPSGVPSGQGVAVVFGNPLSGGTVDLASTDRTLGMIGLSSGTATRIQGNTGHGLTLDNATSPAAIVVSGSQHEIATPVALSSDLVIVNSGRLTISGAVSGNKAISHTGAGTLVLSGSNSYTAGTTLSSGSLALMNSNAIPASTHLAITAGTVAAGPTATALSSPPTRLAQAVRLSHLAISAGTAYTGTYDIRQGGLVIDGGGTGNSLGEVQSWLKSGFNKGKGLPWRGPGLTTSAVLLDTGSTKMVAIAYARNADRGSVWPPIASWYGRVQTGGFSSDTVLLRYAYVGDADMDGSVGPADYTAWNRGRANQGKAGWVTDWQNGDFNYDGTIDSADYTLWNAARAAYAAGKLAYLGKPASPTGTTVSDSYGEVSVGAAVPEPGTIGLLCMASIWLGAWAGWKCRRKAAR